MFTKYIDSANKQLGYINAHQYLQLIRDAKDIAKQHKSQQDNEQQTYFKVPDVIIEQRDQQNSKIKIRKINSLNAIRYLQLKKNKELLQQQSDRNSPEIQKQIKFIQEDIEKLGFDEDDKNMIEIIEEEQKKSLIQWSYFQNDLQNLTVTQQTQYSPEEIEQIKNFIPKDQQNNLQIIQQRKKRNLNLLNTTSVKRYQSDEYKGYLQDWDYRFKNVYKNSMISLQMNIIQQQLDLLRNKQIEQCIVYFVKQDNQLFINLQNNLYTTQNQNTEKTNITLDDYALILYSIKQYFIETQQYPAEKANFSFYKQYYSKNCDEIQSRKLQYNIFVQLYQSIQEQQFEELLQKDISKVLEEQIKQQAQQYTKENSQNKLLITEEKEQFAYEQFYIDLYKKQQQEFQPICPIQQYDYDLEIDQTKQNKEIFKQLYSLSKNVNKGIKIDNSQFIKYEDLIQQDNTIYYSHDDFETIFSDRYISEYQKIFYKFHNQGRTINEDKNDDDNKKTQIQFKEVFIFINNQQKSNLISPKNILYFLFTGKTEEIFEKQYDQYKKLKKYKKEIGNIDQDFITQLIQHIHIHIEKQDGQNQDESNQDLQNYIEIHNIKVYLIQTKDSQDELKKWNNEQNCAVILQSIDNEFTQEFLKNKLLICFNEQNDEQTFLKFKNKIKYIDINKSTSGKENISALTQFWQLFIDYCD